MAIRDALVGDDSSVRTGGSFICDRPSGKRPYVVHVLPSHQRADNLAAGRPMGLVLIVDPEDELEPASDLLRRLFNLTEAEAEVALHMVRGADLKQVAEDLSVSSATVRTTCAAFSTRRRRTAKPNSSGCCWHSAPKVACVGAQPAEHPDGRCCRMTW